MIWNAIRTVCFYAGATTCPKAFDVTPPAISRLTQPVHETWRWRSLLNPRDEYWQHLDVRIAMAGGFYPLLLGTIAMLCWAPFIVLHAMGEPDSLPAGLAIGFAFSMFFVPFLFVTGFIYTGVVALFTVPVVLITLKLLDEKPPRDRVGVFTGSLVAFLATSPFWLLISSNNSTPADSRGRLMGYGLLTLALVLGQLAGLAASIADARRRRRGRLRKAPFRLTLWRLMAAMIPLSLMLSLLRRAELLTLPTALAMLAAGVTAFLASWPVAWLFYRWADRRLRRRRRKRLAASVPRETTATGDAA